MPVRTDNLHGPVILYNAQYKAANKYHTWFTSLFTMTTVEGDWQPQRKATGILIDYG